MRTEPTNPTDQYIDTLTQTSDRGLLAIEERLRAAGRWGVNIGANEARLLAILVQLSGAKRVLEIGTLFGYSAVWLARALPPTGRLWTIERDSHCVTQARQSFAECGVASRIELLEGDAMNKLRELEETQPSQSFDLVFIDANKSAYPDYLEWAERNLRHGGIVVADNVFLGGAVTSDTKPDGMSERQWQGMRTFNERVLRNGKFSAAFVPTSEGLLIGVRT